MGVSITATNSEYAFYMGYGGFFNLRKNIAFALDPEFGENYACLIRCSSQEDYEENSRNAERIINEKGLEKDYSDVLDFLYAPDCDGEISHRTCKNIYRLIANIDYTGKCFQYAAYAKDDYERFKVFLLECYAKRRKMRWY